MGTTLGMGWGRNSFEVRVAGHHLIGVCFRLVTNASTSKTYLHEYNFVVSDLSFFIKNMYYISHMS